MTILFVTSECAPFSKSGGLADVAFSLPPALKKAGDEIAVITPLYRCVREHHGGALEKTLQTTVRLGETEADCGLYRGELNGVTVWFVESDGFFDRPRLYGMVLPGRDRAFAQSGLRAGDTALQRLGDRSRGHLPEKRPDLARGAAGHQIGVHHPQHRLSGAVWGRRA